MRRFFSALLFWTLSLYACSPGVIPPQAFSSSPTLTRTAPTALPRIDQPPDATVVDPTALQDCGNQWANQDLPELSNNFRQSIQALQPEAQASAYAFGENCLRSDGSVVSFTALETDFNITLHVDDLANEAVLGRWIIHVMRIIEDIPADQIAGPRPGRVSILFQSSTAQHILNFYINQYQELPSDLNHTEVYEALQAL